MVHRDLKPENIMLDPDDGIKLIDFGIASQAGAKRLTYAGFTQALGSPRPPPEQVRGKRGDARSDLYAVGVMLYEMLSGKTPFSGPSPLAVMNDRFTGSAADAEDLTQDVFLKLYRNLASFDTHKGSFQTWITTLARNLLVDHFRRTRADRATDSLDASFTSDGDGATLGDRLADPRPSQESHASGLELKVRIQQALAQLSPELREAVVFRDLEDMDYKEIAQVLRIPEGTVKSRISRGRGELARLLQRIEGQVV